MLDLKTESDEKLESYLFTIDGRGAQVKREVFKELMNRKLIGKKFLSPEEYAKAMTEIINK